MLRNNFQSNSFGQQGREEVTLLEKKDQQIRRLQAELEQEKRRADNAVKMLENFKSIQLKYEEGGDTLRNQMARRLKAEEELRKLQSRNMYLEEGIRRYVDSLKSLSVEGEGREGGDTLVEE